MVLLERLESLREDMDELGIRTREDLDSQIEALHQRLPVPGRESEAERTSQGQ